jgi:hypothetical protein
VTTTGSCSQHYQGYSCNIDLTQIQTDTFWTSCDLVCPQNPPNGFTEANNFQKKQGTHVMQGVGICE